LVALAGLVNGQAAGGSNPCLLKCRSQAIQCVIGGIGAAEIVKLMNCVVDRMTNAEITALRAGESPGCRACLIAPAACPELQNLFEEDSELNKNLDPDVGDNCEANICNAKVVGFLKNTCLPKYGKQDPCDNKPTEDTCLAVKTGPLNLCEWDGTSCARLGSSEKPVSSETKPVVDKDGTQKNKLCRDKTFKRSQCKNFVECKWDTRTSKCMHILTEIDTPETDIPWKSLTEFNEWKINATPETCAQISGKYNSRSGCKTKKNGNKCKNMKTEVRCIQAGCNFRKGKVPKKEGKKPKKSVCKDSSSSIFAGAKSDAGSRRKERKRRKDDGRRLMQKI